MAQYTVVEFDIEIINSLEGDKLTTRPIGVGVGK